MGIFASLLQIIMTTGKVLCAQRKRHFNSCRDSQPADLEKFADHMASHYIPNTVIVDATASEVPAQKYLDWMKKGIHVITPNKKMNSGPLKQYRALKQFQRDSYIHFLYEASSSTGFAIISHNFSVAEWT